MCILLFLGQQAESCRPEDVEDNVKLNDIVIIVIHLNKNKTLNAIHSTLLFLNHLYKTSTQPPPCVNQEIGGGVSQ